MKKLTMENWFEGASVDQIEDAYPNYDGDNVSEFDGLSILNEDDLFQEINEVKTSIKKVVESDYKYDLAA
jgi:hypothetical protein